MTALDELDRWAEDHAGEFGGSSSVAVRRGPAERDNRSSHLTIESDRGSVELLVWESGDAELNSLVDGRLRLEHLEFDGPAEFDAVLARLAVLALEVAASDTATTQGPAPDKSRERSH